MSDFADFMARIMVREGAWVIEPQRRDSYLSEFLNRLRTIPATIHQPTGKSPYSFAERGSQGKWFFVWVPDRE